MDQHEAVEGVQIAAAGVPEQNLFIQHGGNNT